MHEVINKSVRSELISTIAGLISVMTSIFFVSRTYVLLPFFFASLVFVHARALAPDAFNEYKKSISPVTVFLGALTFIVFI